MRGSPIAHFNSVPVPQRAYYVQKFRPLGYMAAVAFAGGQHPDMIHRIRDVNGQAVREDQEIFKPQLVLNYGSGLAGPDVANFIDWFLSSSLNTVRSAENLRRYLKELRHLRMCRLHVYCSDGGRVPEAQRMFLHFLTQSLRHLFILRQ